MSLSDQAFLALSRANIANIRPISLLTLVLKCFQRLIYKRLFKFSKRLFFLTLGLISYRSTQDAIYISLQLCFKINRQRKTFRNVFWPKPSVRHLKPPNTLTYAIGIRDLAHDFSKSYLSNRTQTVYINNKDARSLQSLISVVRLIAQLFILYLNDLPKHQYCLISSVCWWYILRCFQSGRNISKNLYNHNSYERMGH